MTIVIVVPQVPFIQLTVHFNVALKTIIALIQNTWKFMGVKWETVLKCNWITKQIELIYLPHKS